MKIIKVVFLCLGIIIGGCAAQKKTQVKPVPVVAPEESRELVQYLQSHWQTPEDYVVSKFEDHDIVFIGEYHRIKHDVELIHNLIPKLYAAGIYNLGIEFGCYEFQDKVDQLITADRYDEDLARWLMFQFLANWGYTEYEDIYRKAWAFNKSLPKDAPKFRVVNLGYKANWKGAKGKKGSEAARAVWNKGDPEAYMANVVLNEFVKKGQKGLIYSGIHHAFTRYKYGNRMGNIIYGVIPDRVFTIFLHSPWRTIEGIAYPAGGRIDAVMRNFTDQRVGFDVINSPFGRIQDNETLYSTGYGHFTLDAFCDGYIFQKQFSKYEGCTVDTKFITRENYHEAMESITDPSLMKRIYLYSPKRWVKVMREDANIKRRFRGLE